MTTLREKIANYSPFAKVILGAVSAALLAYGVYDEATLETILGGCTAVATSFWQLYDTVNAAKKGSDAS